MLNGAVQWAVIKILNVLLNSVLHVAHQLNDSGHDSILCTDTWNKMNDEQICEADFQQ